MIHGISIQLRPPLNITARQSHVDQPRCHAVHCSAVHIGMYSERCKLTTTLFDVQILGEDLTTAPVGACCVTRRRGLGISKSRLHVLTCLRNCEIC
jgi:hypothetical protein